MFILSQMCNGHSIRAKVNKVGKQARRGELSAMRTSCTRGCQWGIAVVS